MSTEPRPRQPRWPFGDARMLWAAAAVITLATIIGVAILLTRPAPVEAPNGSDAADAQPQLPATVDEGAWWRIGWRDDLVAMVDFEQVRIGTVGGGETFRAQLGDVPPSGIPMVRGPAGGQVVVGVAEAGNTQLVVVDAASGRARDLVEVAPAALDVEVARDGRTVLFLAETDDGLAAYGIPIDGSGAVRRLTEAVPRVAVVPDVILAARRPEIADLILDPSSDALAILDCRASCRLRVARPTGGEEIIFNLGEFDSVVAWEGNVIILGSGRCLDLAAGAFVPDLCAGPEQPMFSGLLGFETGIELPAGWHADVRRVAGGRAFDLEAVAIGPAGQVVVLEALGAFGGQG